MARHQRLRQRGIFGLLKPAEPMFFSFLPNGAQEWPSDDDDADSDYSPGGAVHYDDEDEQEACSSKLQTLPKNTKPKTGPLKGRVNSGKRQDAEDTKRQRQSAVKSSSKSARPKKKTRRETRASLAASSSTETQEMGSTDELDTYSPAGSSSEGHQMWGQRLPMIVLQRVFQFVVQAEGAIPYLCRACQVCRLWREAAIHSSLWQHMDLANGRIKCVDTTLQWLAENRLSHLKSINLGGWSKLTDIGLKALVTHCSKYLTSIYLNGCIKLTATSVCLLVDNCPMLHTIDLSHTNADVVSITSMTHILQTTSGHLRLLNLSGNRLKRAPIILKCLKTHCSNLVTLNISNCKFTSDFLMLHIEELQRGCPRLEVLHLAGCMVRASQVSSKVQAESTGFPQLQELSLSVNTNVVNGGIAIDDNMLFRLLVKSHQLKLLDLRGCTHITAVGMQRLPVYDLQHLFISQCSVSRYEGIEAIIHKWRHSLIELDLSWNVFPAMALDIAMKKLSSVPGQSVLRVINLAGTSITAERVRSILEGCPSLVSLHLASCRGLPRGMKRSYHGDCLVQLKSDLNAAPASSLEYVE
ncbi:F-box/LRR-repeat protein 6-like [Acanthaster planci]|uniref:F-box/LRR-repeat protein 6-like n=1 Tax=Acanthaster planci TaxID=133434 RepID=A0A8B7YNM1_ACAPL|nr:F-box/LRR-repeat protein 6-like [Acanthaster planci]XP_022094864.1 F-box/LRR-repeat protein 6-like [Acanthaster planci]